MRKHHLLSSFCCLTILVLALCCELGSGLTNYTINITSNRSVPIPAVCNVTLRCEGGSIMQIGMVMTECGNSGNEVTLCSLMDGSSASFSCSIGSSMKVLNISVSQSAVIYEEKEEEENGLAVDVLARSKQLSCTPVVSCNETGNVSWSTTSGATNVLSDENTITAGVRQYGTYTCYAAGDTTGLVYHAYGGPRFATPNEHHKVTVNQDTELLCSPSSYPAVNFKWYFEFDTNNGSREITCPPNQTNPVIVTDRITIFCSANRSTLVIKETEFDDEGVYRCQAFHRFNERNKTFHLNVKSQLTPLWPAIGIILELSLVAVIILIHEYYQRHQEKKKKAPRSPFVDQPETKEDDTEAYSFPSVSNDRPSHDKRHRIGSITQQSLLPDPTQ